VTEFDSHELAAAVRVDRAIDEALAGGSPEGVDPAWATLLGELVAAHRSDPPPGLRTRAAAAVRRARRRLWLPARAAALALGLLFVAQGLGSLLAGPTIARHLHVAFDEHGFFEGGMLLLALGGVVISGALARRFIDVATVAGVPVGVAFAAHGVSEAGTYAAGAALHFAQGAAAIALAVLWWRARRYVLAASAKSGA
jgi:hypothetical protein